MYHAVTRATATAGVKGSQRIFQAALEQFRAQHLTELTALMGHYAQTAFFLNAFEVQLPEQRTEPVLPV